MITAPDAAKNSVEHTGWKLWFPGARYRPAGIFCLLVFASCWPTHAAEVASLHLEHLESQFWITKFPALSANGEICAFLGGSLDTNENPTEYGVYFVRTLDAIQSEDQEGGLNAALVDRHVVRRPVAISGDGRWLCYSALHFPINGKPVTALMASSTFGREGAVAERELISIGRDGKHNDAECFYPAMSGDGRFIAFASEATNLVGADTGGKQQVFLRDRGPWVNGAFHSELAVTRIVSVSSQGIPGNGRSGSSFLVPGHSVSGDGRRIAFTSVASNFSERVEGDYVNVYVHDLGARTTTLISAAGPFGASANGHCEHPAISGDGQFVVFASKASNLGGENPRRTRQIYVADVDTGEVVMLTREDDGRPWDGMHGEPVISYDGRFIVFTSSFRRFPPTWQDRRSHIVVCDRDPLETGGFALEPHVFHVVSEGLDIAPESMVVLPALASSAKFAAFQAQGLTVNRDRSEWGIVVVAF